MMAIIIAIAIVVLPLLYIVVQYNSITRRRNQIENAISSLDSLFIQRADLIPNLVETVKQSVIEALKYRRPAAICSSQSVSWRCK